jgi:uncharacterized protein (TIGR02001 family)
VSDYRFRGVSLSQDQPAIQASINFDTSDGWYGGLFASSVKLQAEGGPRVQGVAYAGYARRMTSSTHWEIGAEYAAYVGDSQYDYPEAYIGVVAERVSARLYYAPRYFDDDAPVLYAELNGSWPMGTRARLIGHLGGLRRNGSGKSPYEPEPDRERIDARVGVGVALGRFDLQLAWVMNDGQGAYYSYYSGHSDDQGWVLSVAHDW